MVTLMEHTMIKRFKDEQAAIKYAIERGYKVYTILVL
jgi:hypothetical protein